MWKKELSGKKVTLKVLRTINTLKVESLSYLNSSTVIVSSDKTLETVNIENG